MNDTLIKYGSDVQVTSGGSQSDFVSKMVAKLMSTDLSLDETFKSVKAETAAAKVQESLGGAKFAFSNVGDSAPASQMIGNVAQAAGGISV